MTNVDLVINFNLKLEKGLLQAVMRKAWLLLLCNLKWLLLCPRSGCSGGYDV